MKLGWSLIIFFPNLPELLLLKEKQFCPWGPSILCEAAHLHIALPFSLSSLHVLSSLYFFFFLFLFFHSAWSPLRGAAAAVSKVTGVLMDYLGVT